jgi:hypothetical protein
MHTVKLGLATLSACLVACTATGALASSGNTAVSTGSASATVTAPIKLVAVSPLQFGTMAQPVTGGTITVWPTGGYSTTGELGADIAIAQSTVPAAASFTVTGNPGAIFAASGVSQVTISNGSAKMTLNQFTINGSFSGGQIAANGTATFYIGGTLTVTAGQAPGTYTGTFPITVTYN